MKNAIGRLRAIALVAALALSGPEAFAQAPAPARVQAPPPRPVTAFVRNWTRVESWRFFEPPPGGGDARYVDIANRLQLGLQVTTRRLDVVGALQYVQFGGLPTRASGPGALGTGALYFDHSGRTDSRQVYLRYLNVRLKQLPGGFTAQVGRMGYASGAEAASGNAKIEAVKRQRVDSRLIGEFEWSIYQRGYDGVRLDVRRPAWVVTAAAFHPTQGGFEDAAGVTIDDIDLFVGAVTLLPDRATRGTEWQFFAHRYTDRRAVRARPDNSGRSASSVDVQVNSFGATVAGAYRARKGEVDVLAWLVGQTGGWYGQPHRAHAIAAEAGYQWTGVRGRPWLRAGWTRASGDGDPGDDRHGTFFQMLPTARKYSLSTAYSLMNLTDLFVQGWVRPRPALSLRVELHRVGLASAADRWYAGSGAAQQRGSSFGFAGRPSGGARSLGTVLEGAADYSITRRWSINGYVGLIEGGGVVRRSFAGDQLVFAYLEHVLQF